MGHDIFLAPKLDLLQEDRVASVSFALFQENRVARQSSTAPYLGLLLGCGDKDGIGSSCALHSFGFLLLAHVIESLFTSSTLAKVRFSSLNFKTGQNTSLNF